MAKLKEEELENVIGGVDEICSGISAGNIVGNLTNSDNIGNDADITGTSHVGGICGKASNDSAVINCSDIGKICQ